MIIDRRRSPGARSTRRLAALSAVALALSSSTLARPDRTSGEPQPPALLDRLLAAETGCDSICLPADAAAPVRDRIEEVSKQAALSLRALPDAAARVAALNHVVFEGLGIRPSRALADPDNLLLARVLDRRTGYCVGIASLYLVIAERVGAPVYAVATPTHVFLRYDDGATRINIETFQNGADVPDDEYVRLEEIPRASLRRGAFLRNLAPEEFMAQVHNNLGVIYSEHKDYARAAKEYGRAVDLDPRFAAAHYNHGNDRMALADYETAVSLFNRALRLYPTDPWALNNRGLAWRKLGRRKKALRDFREALASRPDFEPARRNLDDLDRSPR
jgi:regulator of sirC expression with transglutaminase-like and TPR domain